MDPTKVAQMVEVLNGLTARDALCLLGGMSAPGEIMSAYVWDKIEASLTAIYSLPHNVVELKREKPPATPADAVKRTMAEIRSGIQGVPKEDLFVGPRLFLRVVGATTRRVYSSQWWFDALILDTLETKYSQIYFHTSERKAVIRNKRRPDTAVALADGGGLVVSGVPANHGEREVPGVADIDDRQ